MKTIKLPHKSSQQELVEDYLQQYNIVVRWSYNRFRENKSEKEIRLLSKSLKNIPLMNSWLVQCAIKDGKAIQTRFKDQKVIFGGKKNFSKRAKGKISKEEFKLKRLNPLCSIGEQLCRGNRCFKLDIENNLIIFKPNRNTKIKFQIPNLRKNIKNELLKIQQLNKVKFGEQGYAYTVSFDTKFIYISFEEFKKEEKETKINRYLGIDINPENIGISIVDQGKILHTQEFSLKPIFDKIFDKSKSYASSDPRMKYFHNKLSYETFEIAKSIANLAKYYHCDNVFIEELELKGKLDNKVSNRKNKNLWKRVKFIQNLIKRCNENNIKIKCINPAYSSFIGNLQHDYTDAVNASLEIGRRGNEIFVKKNKEGFYPTFLTKHQWKKTAVKHKSWKRFFLELKKSKLKYRVSLYECKHSYRVFEHKSKQVINYIFYD